MWLFHCFSILSTSRSSSKGKQFDPKSIAAFCTSSIHPSCCLESVCLKLFLEQISFISLSWKSVHRPPAAFPSPMQAEPLTCHWQGGVTNLFQPCCYIVAATLLLLHCCCYIVATTSLLLHRCCYGSDKNPFPQASRPHHTLSPDSQQGNAEKCNNLN